MKTVLNPKFLLTPMLCIILSAPALATAVVAKHNVQIENMNVPVADLDLSREEGVFTLYKRLKNSASKVCGEKEAHVTGSRIGSLKVKRQYKTCYAEALNSAVQSINNERLTDLHTNNS